MAEHFAESIPGVIQDLVFQRDEEGVHRGWKRELLVEGLAAVEEKYALCCLCQGLLREACLFENGDDQELRCFVCLPGKAEIEGANLYQESINEKFVECPLKERGCKWTDLITQVLPHLSECDFLLVECPLGCVCGKEGEGYKVVQVERRYLEGHQKDQCPRRFIACESCFIQVKACEMNEHIEICEEYLIICPNSCEEEKGFRRLPRKDLSSHLGEECPLQEVECPYVGYGCNEKIERKKIPEHQEGHCPMRPVNCESCSIQMRACEINEHLVICKELLVLCPNSCMEEKEYRKLKRKDLPSHLGEECPLQEVECPYAEYGCNEKMERRLVENHQQDICPLRPVGCEFCSNQIKAYLMNEHIQTCGEYSVLCPNSCLKEKAVRKLKRKDLPFHLGEACPLQEVACPYAEYGCNEKMERRLLDLHVKESIHTHFRLTMVLMQELPNKIVALEKQNAAKDSQIATLKKEIECLTIRGSLDWEITGVRNKIENKEDSHSDIFDVGLYKFQCMISWDCKSKGFVGCFLHILRGDWDVRLIWPIRYRRWFILINHEDNAQNYVKSIEVSEEDLQKFPSFFNKPTKSRNNGFGLSNFIPHNKILDDKYLQNDSIILKIFVERLC